MASQSITFRRHREHNLEPRPRYQPEPAALYVVDGVVIVRCCDVIVSNDADFDAWTALLFPMLESKFIEVGRKYPLAICMDGIVLDRSVGNRYSNEVAVQVAGRFASAIARFGSPNLSKAVVGIEAMRRLDDGIQTARLENYGANLFPDEASAVAFLKRVVASH